MKSVIEAKPRLIHTGDEHRDEVAQGVGKVAAARGIQRYGKHRGTMATGASTLEYAHDELEKRDVDVHKDASRRSRGYGGHKTEEFQGPQALGDVHPEEAPVASVNPLCVEGPAPTGPRTPDIPTDPSKPDVLPSSTPDGPQIIPSPSTPPGEPGPDPTSPPKHSPFESALEWGFRSAPRRGAPPVRPRASSPADCLDASATRLS
jgi:hypothetical protein